MSELRSEHTHFEFSYRWQPYEGKLPFFLICKRRKEMNITQRNIDNDFCDNLEEDDRAYFPLEESKPPIIRK